MIMRVAVCVSGLVNGNLLKRNNEVLKSKFPYADFYYATWSDQKNAFEGVFSNQKCFYFDPPNVHYHPYEAKDFDSVHWRETKNWIVKNKKMDWSKHHTKQHIIHALLLKQIEKEYDVIVRTRFDAFAWKDPLADFTPFVEDSLINQRANCFAVTRKSMFKDLYESDYETHPKMRVWCLDQLIIHPRSLFDPDTVLKLYEDKLLRAAEYGWHQIISEPFGNNHRNWHGWVNHEKNVEKRFLDEG